VDLFSGAVMRVVLASGSVSVEKRLRELLLPYGARLECTELDAHLHLRLLTGNTTPLVFIDATTSGPNGAFSLTDDLRLRMVHRAQPEIVVLGQSLSHGRSLEAFEAGVDNWLLPTQSKVLAAQYHFVQCVNECRERGPRWSEGISFLEDLNLRSSGIVEMSDGTLTAIISIREGRVGFVHFPELATEFTVSIDAEAHARCAEVDALRQTLGYPVYDWDRALSAHGCWARARLREALARRWQQVLRWMAGTTIVQIEWRPSDNRFSDELAFDLSGLLSALDEEVPHSFARGRISFSTLRAENDRAALQ
jgi:hypothetical protein